MLASGVRAQRPSGKTRGRASDPAPPLTDATPPAPGAIALVEAWFASRGWTPFDFQRQTWSASLAGDSGLVHAPTGMGKSLAVWLGPVIESIIERAQTPGVPSPRARRAEPIRVLWLTPMRALASDTAKALAAPIADLDLPWTIEQRTGDTSASLKARQRRMLPSALVTTPESLSLLLSYPDARAAFATLRAVVVDEWHELLGTKRGVQTELCLARLRTFAPGLRTWGLSATLANLQEAMDVLLGGHPGAASAPRPGRLIRGVADKAIRVRTILPQCAERFPWSGHLGLRLLEPVITAIEGARTTLLFTNTRSQTELWFRAISRARPDWLGQIAVHHGSLDRELRAGVEALLRDGALRCVVCTSSLDLGVDFSPVEQVIQVGSPKGVARLMQRAGRSGHQPGAVSTAVCVPTNAMELVEFAGARAAIETLTIEGRTPLVRPLDVLVQHVATLSLGDGVDAAAALAEARSTAAFASLTDEEWSWCLSFLTGGGPALRAYPQYARLVESAGRLSPASPAVARLHRASIGTITADLAMTVRVLGGSSLGTIEESFIARLKPGERFAFAGRTLELVRTEGMTALVRRSPRASGIVPRWGGGRTPLSSQLAHAVRALIDRAALGEFIGPEMDRVRPLLELQARWSALPRTGELLIERLRTRDGEHAFIYPLQGRQVHEGLGALLAHRLSRLGPCTVAATCDDYGLELLCSAPLPDDESGWRALLGTGALVEDLLDCVNSTELTRRQFRDIARVAGLIFQGFPGGGASGARTARQLQASSELFFEVFREFDPSNRLLDQARREVLEQQLDVRQLRRTLEELEGRSMLIARPARLTPLSFSLWAERMRTQHVTSEGWSERVQRMSLRLEAAADREQTRASAKAQRARDCRVPRGVDRAENHARG